MGGVALASTGVLAGLHVACDHADDDAASPGCAICRHLDDGSLLVEPVWSTSAGKMVAAVIADVQPDIDCLPRPARRGRGPPAHVL